MYCLGCKTEMEALQSGIRAGSRSARSLSSEITEIAYLVSLKTFYMVWRTFHAKWDWT